MSLILKPYTGYADLRRMQAMLAESIQTIGDCGYLHVGDIPHRLYNGLRHFPDREQLVHLWETGAGQLVGWAILFPHLKAFDTQIHADFKGTDTERAILEWTVDAISQHVRANHTGDNPPLIHTDLCVGDVTRMEMLAQLGFTDQKPFMCVTTRPLDTIPDPVLPDGFTIRPSAGLPDVARLIAVHSGAFDSLWTLDQYEMVLNSPGFVAENEFVVVAPDGEFAAFTIIWLDEVNKVGLFEPVGTHKAYQRRGLGRALMHHAMHVMRDNGMLNALVCHDAGENAAARFYQSLGFRTVYDIHDYVKQVR